jgi:hypothetical protein
LYATGEHDPPSWDNPEYASRLDDPSEQDVDCLIEEGWGFDAWGIDCYMHENKIQWPMESK